MSSASSALSSGAGAAPSPAERALVESLALALVREYLAKRKYKATLETLQNELVGAHEHRTQTTSEHTNEDAPARASAVVAAACSLCCVLAPRSWLSVSLCAAHQAHPDDDDRSGQVVGHQQVRCGQLEERRTLPDAARPLRAVHVRQLWTGGQCSFGCRDRGGGETEELEQERSVIVVLLVEERIQQQVATVSARGQRR